MDRGGGVERNCGQTGSHILLGRHDMTLSRLPDHRRLWLHRLRPGEGVASGRPQLSRADDNSRGDPRRLKDVANDIDFITGDIRDAGVGGQGCQGHGRGASPRLRKWHGILYSMPELVLDVGVHGMVNVIDACRHHNVGTLIFASSSEVYQTPQLVPTDENAPLIVPDVGNPRTPMAPAR